MKYVVGNYKMYLGVRESVALARGVLRGIRGSEVMPEIVLCPSFPALTEVRKIIARSHVTLGAQNVAAVAPGAMTGEVAAAQLADNGCEYVIVGHSERRQWLNESDDLVREKLVQAFAAGLTPILCVGESAQAREDGTSEAMVARQLAALRDVTLPRKRKLVIAYEPIWAIGKGTPATPADVIAMHRFIRSEARRYIDVAEEDIVVLYGGSVDGSNAYEYLREREVNGVLLGGASVKLHECLAVIGAAQEVMEAQTL